MSFHDEDEIANDSLNPALGEIIEATLSRRRLLLGGLGTAGVAFRRRAEPEDLTVAPEIEARNVCDDVLFAAAEDPLSV